MNSQIVKRAVADLLLARVAGVGTVDCRALDVRDYPSQLRKRPDGEAQPNPYWLVRCRGWSDRDATTGSGGGDRPTFRDYRIEVEGWLGIRAADVETERWEQLLGRIGNVLRAGADFLCPRIAAAGASYYDLVSLEFGDTELVEVRGERASFRAHHATISTAMRVYVVVRR